MKISELIHHEPPREEVPDIIMKENVGNKQEGGLGRRSDAAINNNNNNNSAATTRQPVNTARAQAPPLFSSNQTPKHSNNAPPPLFSNLSNEWPPKLSSPSQGPIPSIPSGFRLPSIREIFKLPPLTPEQAAMAPTIPTAEEVSKKPWVFTPFPTTHPASTSLPLSTPPISTTTTMPSTSPQVSATALTPTLPESTATTTTALSSSLLQNPETTTTKPLLQSTPATISTTLPQFGMMTALSSPLPQLSESVAKTTMTETLSSIAAESGGSDLASSRITKTIRLVVFNKSYSVPMKKIDTEAGILAYVCTLPAAIKDLQKHEVAESSDDVAVMIKTEAWEFKNEEGDTIRLEDWEDMVYAGGRIKLVSNLPSDDDNGDDDDDDRVVRKVKIEKDDEVESKPSRSQLAASNKRGRQSAASKEDNTQMYGKSKAEEPPRAPSSSSRPSRRADAERSSGSRFGTDDGKFSTPKGRLSQRQPGSHSQALTAAVPTVPPLSSPVGYGGNLSLSITVFKDLKLPCPYPPSQRRAAKHGFGVTTNYARVMKNILGDNYNEDLKLQILEVAVEKDTGREFLIGGDVIDGHEYDTLEDLGFRGGNGEYMARIVDIK